MIKNVVSFFRFSTFKTCPFLFNRKMSFVVMTFCRDFSPNKFLTSFLTFLNGSIKCCRESRGIFDDVISPPPVPIPPP